VQTEKCVWKAKNVPHDFLDMEVPMYDKDADWVDLNKKVFVTATAYNQIRLYDVRQKPRPVLDCSVGDKPFTCVRVDPLKNHIITAANTMAWVNMMDLKMKCRVVGGFKGISGSVRSMAYHPKESYLATVGLDRYLHIFSTSLLNRKSVIKTYMKQKLNAVLMSSHPFDVIENSEDKELQHEKSCLTEKIDQEIEESSAEEDTLSMLNTIGDDKRDCEIQNEKVEKAKPVIKKRKLSGDFKTSKQKKRKEETGNN